MTTSATVGRFVALWLISLSAAARAQSDSKDPLDVALDRCLAGKEALASDAGMSHCIALSVESWDKRLNTSYGALMKTLDPASRALLLSAQRSWVEYRKKDEDFANGPWRASTGRDAQVMIASSRLEELKQRVHALETYGAH